MYGSRIPDSKERLPFESDYDYYDRITSLGMEHVDLEEGVN